MSLLVHFHFKENGSADGYTVIRQYIKFSHTKLHNICQKYSKGNLSHVTIEMRAGCQFEELCAYEFEYNHRDDRENYQTYLDKLSTLVHNLPSKVGKPEEVHVTAQDTS